MQVLQLRRITSGGRFVPEIDGLRFVAIASVVLWHFHGYAAPGGDTFGPLVAHGYRGVNLFYVISGFILGLPFAAHYLAGRPAVPLRAYFLRRITRLEPPYVLNLLICCALLVAIDGVSFRALLPHLAASLGYLHSLGFGEQSTINPVAWTLEVEVQFYCLVPLLARVFKIRSPGTRRAVLLAAILIAGAAQKLCWQGPPRAKLSIAFAIQFFLAGFLLADLYLTEWKERPARHWAWDLVSLVCWPPLFLAGDYAIWLTLPLLMLAVYVAAFRGVVFHYLFTHPAITAMGGMCYTIYLFHYQLISLVLRHTRNILAGAGFDAYLAVQTLFYLAAVAAVSGLYFVLIERPCMARDWPRKLWGRISRAAAGS